MLTRYARLVLAVLVLAAPLTAQDWRLATIGNRGGKPGWAFFDKASMAIDGPVVRVWVQIIDGATIEGFQFDRELWNAAARREKAGYESYFVRNLKAHGHPPKDEEPGAGCYIEMYVNTKEPKAMMRALFEYNFAKMTSKALVLQTPEGNAYKESRPATPQEDYLNPSNFWGELALVIKTAAGEPSR